MCARDQARQWWTSQPGCNVWGSNDTSRLSGATTSTARCCRSTVVVGGLVAECGDGGEQFSTVANRGYAEADQIVGGQLRQHLDVDVVALESLLVLFEPQTVQPCCDVHHCLA